MTFGGGLVEGDNLNISVKIGYKCCILVSTLSFPKVYCCENGCDSQQNMEYTIDSKALLCILPEPLVCFKQASYIQMQTFHLKSDANLVFLDWFTSGRYTRGERWVFSKLKSVTTIFVDDKLAFKESQCMQNTPFLSIEKSMKSYDIVGMCMIMGPDLEPLYASVLSELGSCKRYGEKPEPDLLFAASPLCLDETTPQFGCIVRFASKSVSDAMKKIEELLEPLFLITGGNPFQNK